MHPRKLFGEAMAFFPQIMHDPWKYHPQNLFCQVHDGAVTQR